MNKDSFPLVTIIFPLTENKDEVLRSLKSINQQCYPFLEVIVIHDLASKEKAEIFLEITSTWYPTHPHLKVLFLSIRNFSFNEQLHEAIKIASGHYLTFLIPGEIYAPSRLSCLITGLKKHKREWGFSNLDVQCSHSDWHEWFNKNLNTLSKYPNVAFSLLYHNLIITLGNLIFSRQLYDRVGSLNGDRFTSSYDFVFKAIFYDEPYRNSKKLLYLSLQNHEVPIFLNFHTSDLYKLFCKLYIESVSINLPINPQAPCKQYWPQEFFLFENQHQVKTFPPIIQMIQLSAKKTLKFILIKLRLLEPIKKVRKKFIG